MKSTNQGGGPRPPSPTRAHTAQPWILSTGDSSRNRHRPAPAYLENPRPRSGFVLLTPHRKGRNAPDVGPEPERPRCGPIGSGRRRPCVSRLDREAPTDGPRGGAEGCGSGDRGARRAGRWLSGQSPPEWGEVTSFGLGRPGPRKDERTEDAGPLEAQVTEPGCGGAATGFFPDPCWMERTEATPCCGS